MLASWTFWAVLSAVFAALTAIFAKVGVTGINSDFATLLRTVVVLASAAAMLPPAPLPASPLPTPLPTPLLVPACARLLK